MFSSNTIHLSIVSRDNISIARIKKELHHRQDIEIETYKNGEQFLASIYQHSKARQSLPIVLLDSKLRSREFENAREGLDVLKEIMIHHKNYGVIMLLSPNEKKIKNEAQKAGAYTSIIKNEHMIIRLTNYLENLISQQKFKKQQKLNKISLITFASTLTIFSIIAFFLIKNYH